MTSPEARGRAFLGAGATKRGLKHVGKEPGSLNTMIDLEPETDDEVGRHWIASEHVATLRSRAGFCRTMSRPPSSRLRSLTRTSARGTEQQDPDAGRPTSSSRSSTQTAKECYPNE